MNKLLDNLQFKVYTDIVEKSEKNGKRRIRGYASTDVLDRQNEVISLEALRQAADHLLENPTVFYEHKHDSYPVGLCVASKIDDKGLLIDVEISQTADQLWTLIQEGILNRFSVGGRVTASEEKVGEDKKPYNEITGIELFEVSVVGLPANPAAKFEVVNKSFSMAITEEIEKRKEGSGMEKEIKKIEDKSIEKVEDTLTGIQKEDLEKYDAEDKATASKAKEEKVETVTVSDDTVPNIDISGTGDAVDTTVEETKVEGEKVEEKQDENVEVEKKDEVAKEEVAEAKAEPVEKVEESSEKEVEKTEEKPTETSDEKTEKSEEIVAEEKPAEEKVEELKAEEKPEVKTDNSIVTDEEFDKLVTEDVSKPYPNEHAARIREPGDFQEGSFRSQPITEGVRLIIGRLIGETTTTAQAYRFHVDYFTAEEAKQWLKDHEITYILFEPATQEDNTQPEKKEEVVVEAGAPEAGKEEIKIEEKPVEDKKEDKEIVPVRVLSEEKLLELLNKLNDKIDALGEKMNALELANQVELEVEEKVLEKPKAEEKKEESKVEKKAEEKVKEEPQRKSFIADAPYADGKEDKEKKEKDTKKTTEKGWTRIVYGTQK